jgi:hypothetical protein
MMPQAGREESEDLPGYRISWFAPDRPVNGTVYVRPASDPVDDATQSAFAE